MEKKSSNLEKSFFLADLLATHIHLDERVTAYVNLLLLISTFVFALTFNKFLDGQFKTYNMILQLALIVLIVASFITLIMSLLAVRPRIGFKGKLNIFYYGTYIKRLNKENYKKAVLKTIDNDKNLIEAYTDEIYELSQKVLLPVYQIIRIGTDILIAGVGLSFLLFILFMIIK